MGIDAVRFQRANYLVSDLDRAIPFYADILGFEIDVSKTLPPTAYAHQLFGIEPGVALRAARLSTPSQTRVMALTEMKGARTKDRALPRHNAIVLEVADVDEIVARSKAIGLEVMPEYKLKTDDGREGREVGILDFDDNLVVIYTIIKPTDI
jgi:catechol 2,3-dioxygenase-like lactoylglutathione lyase family enzyme